MPVMDNPASEYNRFRMKFEPGGLVTSRRRRKVRCRFWLNAIRAPR